MESEGWTNPAPMPAGSAPRRRRRGVWIAIVVAATVLVGLMGGGAYLVAGTIIAANDRVTTDRVLEQSRSDNDKVASLVKAPDLQSDLNGNVDYAKVRSGLEANRAGIATGKATLAAGRLRLQQAAARVRSDSASFLVVPQRGAMERDRERLEAVTTAFTAADAALSVADDQLQFNMALVAATEMFDQVGAKLNADDVAGTLALYGQLDTAVQQVVELAKSASIPEQLRILATALQSTAADVKKVVQAVQAKDLRTATALEPKLDSDEKALNTFDENAAKAQAAQIFQPYRARYETALRAAGFRVAEV